MSTFRQSTGRWGEEVAARHLEQKGYTIISRNLKTPHGEIDLVARLPEPDGDVLVFVEVKTRRSSAYGFPEQSITAKKKEHLLNSAQAFRMDHPELGNTWRIDVIAIQQERDRRAYSLQHFENAIN